MKGISLNKTWLPILIFSLWAQLGAAARFTDSNGLGYYSLDGNSTEVAVYLTTNCDPSAITELDFPSEVEYSGKTYIVQEIGHHGFENLENLTSVRLPSTIKVIGYCAFQECPNLSQVELGSSLQEIQRSAFESCTSLESIFIPASVSKIDQKSFRNCLNLKDIIIEKANENYSSENGILFNKEKTRGISFPAAQGDVILPEGIVTFDSYFFTWERITSLFIPSTVEEFPYYQYKNYNFKLEISPGNSTYAMRDGLLTNKEGNELLVWKNPPAELVIPEYITKIGDGVFFSNRSIKTLTLHSDLTEIGMEAFCGCENLQTIYSYALLPPEVKYGNFLIYDDFGSKYLPLKVYVNPESTEAYRKASVWRNFDIYPFGFLINGDTFREGDFEFTVVSEFDYKAAASTYLKRTTLTTKTEVMVPEKVVHNGYTYTVVALGDKLFEKSRYVAGVQLPATLESINYRAFAGCNLLETVSLPPGLKKIGDYAFADSGIKTLFLPASVSDLNGSAFADTYISFSVSPENPFFTALDKMLLSKDGKELISWQPQTKTVEIPEFIKKIGKYAFCYCSNLETLSLPSTLEVIAEGAFKECFQLKDVYFHSVVPPHILKNVWPYFLSNIYVPLGSVDLYKDSRNLDSWKIKGIGCEAIRALVVTDKSSNETKIDTADISKIEVTNNGLNFVADSDLFFSFADINKVFFTAIDSGIKEVPASDESGLSWSISGELLTLSGIGDNVDIHIFSLAGIPVLHFRTSDTATLDISRLPAGTYILRAGENAAKFIKR